jgi:hypothetical protein
MPGATILLIFRRAFDMAFGSEIFWTALSERRRGLELGGAAKPEKDTFGHEPALVARCCSPAKLLGFPKLVGIRRCNDSRRRHQRDRHSQGGRAAMASCRISEQLRPISRLNRASAWARSVGGRHKVVRKLLTKSAPHVGQSLLACGLVASIIGCTSTRHGLPDSIDHLRRYFAHPFLNDFRRTRRGLRACCSHGFRSRR